MKFRVFWDVAPCSLIAKMMEAVSTSETSVHSNETIRRYNPEDSKLRQVIIVLRTKIGLNWLHLDRIYIFPTTSEQTTTPNFIDFVK
jgi:hypothetical protein